MRVEIEELSPCQMKMAVEVPAEVVEQELDLLYRELQKKVQLKGFRKGKAPRSVLARYYKSSVEQDLIKKIVPDSCRQIIRERDLKAVGQLKVDNVKLEEENKSLKYTAVIEVIPPIPLPEYTGMKFTRQLRQISSRQVDLELERLREAHARAVSVDRPAQRGDYVMIRYLGRVAGENLPEGEGEALAVVVGSDQFLPEVGFESHLIGLRKGDQKEFSGSFPSYYENFQLAGKEVVFRVWMEEVKLRELPEVDDEFAREVGDYENLEDLEAGLLQELEQRERQRALAVLKQEVLERLVRQNPFPVPNALVDEEVKQTLSHIGDQLRSQGKSLEVPQKGRDGFMESLRESALNRIRGELIIERISEAEGIQVTDEEVEADIQRLSVLARQSPEAFRAQVEKGDGLDRLRRQMRFERTLDLLIEQSNIQEVVIEMLEGEGSGGEGSSLPQAGDTSEEG